MAPPFRADQVGSLIRPKELIEAHSANTFTGSSAVARKSARDVERKAVAEAVKQQLDRGITPITSGEYERVIFYGGFFGALMGIEDRFVDTACHRPGFPTARLMLQMGMKSRDVSYAKGKVRHEKSAYLEDWLYVRSLLPEERWKDVKMTIPTPTWFHAQLPDGEVYSHDVYSSDAEYLTDVSAAVRKEILTLYDYGLRVVQIDDPNLSFFADEDFVNTSKRNNYDLERLMDMYVKAHNDAIRNLPSDLRVGVHLCRGNFPNGIHISEGSYERIAEKLFNELNHQYYCLEFDSARAGGFEPLRSLPANKAVVLGLVTTKFAEMENVDELKEKVYRAADIIAEGQKRSRAEVLRDCLAVSPQCGFASQERGVGVGMNWDVMWEKLELVKSLAESIWPSE